MNPLQPLVNHQFNPFEPHPELDNVEVPKMDDNDPDAFGIFAARGMAPPDVPTPAEVRREVKDRTANIFASHRTLQNILERHEATIQRRWEKKSKTQRLTILLQLWPGMPLTHRPDFAAFYKHAENLNSVALQHRSSFIWPIVNQEDLGEPKTLPLLLNSRGRHHPSVFAAFDGELQHLGKVTMAVVPKFLNQWVMILNGVTRDEEYGRLISWDEHDEAFNWMHTRRQFLPGEGLLILELQERLLGFLVACCKTILHDIPFDRMTSDEFPIQSEPTVKGSLDGTGFSTLSAMAKEASYRVPAELDLEKIESLLSARVVRAEDHIWSLREDPSYFAETVSEVKEHRLEMLRDILGNVHPATKPLHDDVLWARVIGDVMLESFFQLESFTELRNQATHLRELSAKYNKDISPEKDLPEEYLAALLKFQHYLKQATKGSQSQLKTSVFASPPLRQYFVRDIPISATSSMISAMENSRAKMDKLTRQLIWLLRTLWEDGYTLFLCRMTNVVDELGRLLESEPKAMQLVSPYVAMIIGEISIKCECLRQLEIFQPWANGFENELVDREEGIKKEFEQRTQTWAKVLDTFKEQNGIPLRPLGDPSGGRFQYPVGKRRTKANNEILRQSEANLDAFWNEVDSLLSKNVADLNGTAYRQLLMRPRYLQRTPEWIEPAAKKQEKTTDDREQSNESYDYVAPFSRLFQETATSPSARAEALAAATGSAKTKRRGVPGTEFASEGNVVVPPAGSTPDVQPEFAVDARSLKVFRIIFFDPAANTTAGEVPWRDFLYAMECTGFSAQKLYGSVWHFQPTRLDVERSIQFHEPHPRAKIPFVVARRHGRRLNRAYGWRGSMFVLKEKERGST